MWIHCVECMYVITINYFPWLSPCGYRLWVSLDDWWHMEINLSSLHASSEGINHYVLLQVSISFFSKYAVEQIPALNMPDVCTNAPVHGMALCKQYCELLEKQTPPLPTALKECLKHCHVTGGLYSILCHRVVTVSACTTTLHHCYNNQKCSTSEITQFCSL